MNFKNQKELFNWIWNNRDHVSEVSGLPLIEDKNHFQFYWQFAHVLGKGPYPSYKLNPDNIMLMLPGEHERQEEFEVFTRKHMKLKRQYYKEIYGKEFLP